MVLPIWMVRVDNFEDEARNYTMVRVGEGDQANKPGELLEDRSSGRKWAQRKRKDLLRIEEGKEKGKRKS